MRRWARAVAVSLAAAICQTPAAGSVAVPSSIGALGDSITAGFATSGGAFSATENSWVTGTSRAVNSIARRLGVPAARAANEAVPGTTMRQLEFQVGLLPRGVDLVTIEMGANDACNGPTPAAVVGSQLDGALKALAARAPRARVVVLSVFDLPAMWDAVKANRAARRTRTWCLPATSARGRARFERTLRGLNARLATVCRRHPGCAYDGGAAFRIRWRAVDISTVDYFHPSVAGQRTIASALWATGLF
jgi:lysophospholipase L1-like esterase